MFDVSRILAIPEDNPDHVQCGISAANHRALVQDRGGIKLDGTRAKASLLKKDFSKSYEKAGFIKGDKKLSESSPSNRGLAVTDKKGFQSESVAAKKIKRAIAGQAKGGKVVKGVKPSDRASNSTQQKIPFEVAKELGVKLTITGKVTRINAKTKPELIEKALEHHFAQEKASKYLNAGKKSGLPQYKDLDEKSVRAFAAKVFEGYVNPNLQDFDGMTQGGGKDFSDFVKAGLLKEVEGDRGQRHSLTSVGREFAKEIMTLKSKGEFAKEAKEALKSKPKSKPKQEPTRAQKLGMTEAEYEAFKKKVARL